MADRQRACVIGAGVSGLTASKSLGDWGVSYTCFEASDDVGGNWYFRNPNGRSSAYRSLHIDTSKSAISFADFPMDGRYPDFPHHTEIHGFLREYADHFALRDRIRFNTTVQHAQRLDDGAEPDPVAQGEAVGVLAQEPVDLGVMGEVRIALVHREVLEADRRLGRVDMQ